MYQEKILIVDDEQVLLDMLALAFKRERFENLATATSGCEAMQWLEKDDFDAILLDVNLPDCTGFELCHEIRKHTFAPVLFITAMDSDLDKIQGLSIGGDDYITKPFHPLEVVARVKAIFRRQGYANKAMQTAAKDKVGVYSFGAFVLDLGTGTFSARGEQVELTAKEFLLLKHFCKNPSRVFTSSQLYEAVWGEHGFGEEKTVAMHISRLRKKLAIDEKDKGILTLRGIGYKFVPPGKEQAKKTRSLRL